LYTRRLDQPMAVELPGTENPRGPFFSPDSRWLGFASTTARKLYKISVDGGATVPLMDMKGPLAGASWSGNLIIVAQSGQTLVRIADNGGGQPTSLGPYAPGEVIQVSPQILPGDKTVLFAGNTGNEGGAPDPDRGSVEAISLTDGHRKNILKGAAFPRYVASHGNWGHLLYTFRGALYAVPFDPDKLELRGTAVPVLNDVMGGIYIAGKFDVSGTGTLVYQKGSAGSAVVSTIQWIDSGGKTEPLLAKPGDYADLRFSPDGRRIAVSVRDGQTKNIQVYEWQTGRTISLTFGGEWYEEPVWTPDGQFVIFGSATGKIYSARADGSGQPRQIMDGNPVYPDIPWSFSPDGKRLVYFRPMVGHYQLWTVPVEEQEGGLRLGTAEPLLKSESNDIMPQFSPDGKWIAYRSNLSGMPPQVYVRPASGKGGQWVVSTGAGADMPVWLRNGHDLLYADTAENRIMAVTYTENGDTFVPDKPRVWLAKLEARNDFDVSPDGKRVAAVVPQQAATPTPAPQNVHEVVFLQNFFDELRRRVPAK
jgi:eukaryotic-like serine/threonine-protein kinase